MKKYIYLGLFSIALLFSSCNTDTESTEMATPGILFQTPEAAENALNGIYRLCYDVSTDVSTSWTAENFGVTSYSLVGDLMGEDFVQAAVGNGWFYEDYRFNVAGDFASTSGRPYAIWKFHYMLIDNANYIIVNEANMQGNEPLRNNVVGQAYAIRAYAYFMLAQFYQQTYIGNETAKGVPIYTTPTTSDRSGEGRGTLENTYQRINEDIDKAIELLKAGLDAGASRKIISHLDYYSANGIKARVALVQGNYQRALEAAQIAVKGASMLPVSDFLGSNDATKGNVLWGFQIIADQSTTFSSFFSHMDADGDKYASNSQKCIASWLYDQIPTTDTRKNAWWRGNIAENEIVNRSSIFPYCQIKFKFSDVATSQGDYIVMRAEEMQLIIAEAQCALGKYNEAKASLGEFMALRDSNYETAVNGLSLSSTYNSNTIGTITTLRDYILLQRRIELWGEYGRIFDLKRLQLGFNRNYNGSNHTSMMTPEITKAASNFFTMVLPQKEFDSNMSLDEVVDQNPFPVK